MQPGSAPSDELCVLQIIASRLEERAIAYMLTGSLAMSAYTQPRMTRGIDLVVRQMNSASPISWSE